MSAVQADAAQSLAVVLQASGLRYTVGRQVLLDLPALQIPPGVTWVGGGEGRGKTTLLRLLAGDLAASNGTLHLHGATLPGAAAAYRQQTFWMDPRTNAHDQVTAHQFFATTATRYAAWDAGVVVDLCGALGLGPHLDKPLYMLSTGSKRKVWLVAALASGAALTLLDEPFAALDKTSIRCLLEYLQEAATHTRRAWVVADYEAPPGVPLAQTIALGA